MYSRLISFSSGVLAGFLVVFASGCASASHRSSAGAPSAVNSAPHKMMQSSCDMAKCCQMKAPAAAPNVATTQATNGTSPAQAHQEHHH